MTTYPNLVKNKIKFKNSNAFLSVMALEDLAIINQQVEGVNIFEATGIAVETYKCVQFYLEEKAYLRIGKQYHRDILVGFLEECNEAGLEVASAEYLTELKKMDPLFSHYVQKGEVMFETDKYKITGAGSIFMRPKVNAMFGLDSMFLGIKLDVNHIDEIKPYLPKELDVGIM